MKTILFEIILKLHVLAGILSIVAGLIAMTSRKKGGKLHNISGLVFYSSMAFIFVSAISFVLIYPNKIIYHFFLTIGIVSFYPCFSGKRLLSMKKGLDIRWYDWLALAVILISGVVMFIYGTVILPFGSSSYSILFLVFGVLSLVQGIGDLRLFLVKIEAKKLHWFFGHAAKMIGAYSAAVTAFCVNIVPRYLPEGTSIIVFIIIWIGPSVVFALVTRYIVKRYRVKFKLAH
jgi:uncharacterized membrane protein HdeD (DUF308 family)